MTLENLIGKGLQREPAHRDEIARFMEKINQKLADAQRQEISLDSRYDIAYEAVLQLGLVALRANDLRPDSREGHHILALQTLNKSIAYPRENLRLLEEFRKQRAAGLYDGSFVPSERELAELINVAKALNQHFIEWLKHSRSDLAPQGGLS